MGKLKVDKGIFIKRVASNAFEVKDLRTGFHRLIKVNDPESVLYLLEHSDSHRYLRENPCPKKGDLSEVIKRLDLIQYCNIVEALVPVHGTEKSCGIVNRAVKSRSAYFELLALAREASEDLEKLVRQKFL